MIRSWRNSAPLMRSECSVLAEYAMYFYTACKSNYNMLHFFYVTQDIMSVSEGEHAFMLIPNGE